MKYSVVITAAGSGTRTNLGYNKVFYPISESLTVLDCSINLFLSDDDCEKVVVVSQKENFDLIKDNARLIKTEGSTTRSLSVINGLKHVDSEYVMIHDGARPFVTYDLIKSLKDKLVTCDACLLMIPAVDTIKVVKDDIVVTTPPRSSLYQAQTPQAFKTELIKKAYAMMLENEVEVSDDASCVELFTDTKVHVVLGNQSNKKITTVEDIEQL